MLTECFRRAGQDNPASSKEGLELLQVLLGAQGNKLDSENMYAKSSRQRITANRKAMLTLAFLFHCSGRGT